MTTERLTTLAAVKEWLDITTDTSDTGLIRLIDAASRFVINWLGIDSFRVQAYTQNFRGNGKNTVQLYNWPIASITSVGTGGQVITASSIGAAGLPGPGYTVSDRRIGPQSVDLYGYFFPYGAPSQVVYTAGWRTTDTSVLVAADPTPTDPINYTPSSGGVWSQDLGVTLNGVTATQVDDVTPAAGSYYVDEWGNYIFNDTDAGKTVVITYDYTPVDVSQAVVEMIGEWYRRKDRIGVLSKTIGGQETVTFSTRDMGEGIRTILQTYKAVI